MGHFVHFYYSRDYSHEKAFFNLPNLFQDVRSVVVLVQLFRVKNA